MHLTCWLQELELLDKDNNPLTHAKYHREKVREAGERERRPLPLEIPKYLEQSVREYLTQVSLGTRRISGVWLSFDKNVSFWVCAFFLTVPSDNRGTETMGRGRGKRTADNKPEWWGRGGFYNRCHHRQAVQASFWIWGSAAQHPPAGEMEQSEPRTEPWAPGRRPPSACDLSCADLQGSCDCWRNRMWQDNSGPSFSAGGSRERGQRGWVQHLGNPASPDQCCVGGPPCCSGDGSSSETVCRISG